MVRFLLCSLWLAAAAMACGGDRVDRPEEVLEQFLDLMERSRSDERALRDAFGLLDGEARGRLKERAERARTLSGGEYEAWEMLVPGRFRLRISPAERGSTRTKIDDDHALVTVTGEREQVAHVPLVKEHGQWRIALQVPSQTAVQGPGRVSP